MAYMGQGQCSECGFDAEYEEEKDNHIETLNSLISDLKTTIAGMRECANTDWENECGKLYDFLCEHKPYRNYPRGKLLDEYHKATK